ncbi:MAG: twin-arginine translocase TatA/TatE family subunit, partial [Gammaproteobacteria bacterium]|nr:twin-arginine translocase TatA/TatE family subunit [Gammaproteobacteria bacterium]
MGGISVWQLLILAVIVLLLFGTKKLRNVGADLGSALKGFRSSMGEGEKAENNSAEQLSHDGDESVIDG